MYLVSLNDSIDALTYGAKAAHLSKMRRQGFPVPDGFAISKLAFTKFYEGKESLDELTAKISESLGNIGASAYMVRSSAIGEDSNENSFAGQLDSFISDPNIETIIENLQKCWASYHKDNVVSYQSLTGKKLMGMGVVIQKLIQPDYAGVIFTRSHLIANQMLVEYVVGHGEKLVSGDITPFSFHYHKSMSKMESDYLPSLKEGLEIAENIERFYGAPTDIEWALKDGKFYVVQARPITTQLKEKKIYWSNTNVNENYPDPISPLLYSIARQSYYHYFKNLSKLFAVPTSEIRRLESAYSNIIGVHGCKMYYNMSSIHEIISASPFSNMLMKSFDNFVGYDKESNATKKSSSLGVKFNFLKEFINKNRQLKQNVIEFENIVDRFTRNVKNAIVYDDLRHCFHEFVEIRMHSWYRASLADFFAMTYHGLLGKFCSKYYGVDATGVQNKLIQAIPGLISSKPIIEMHEIITLIRNNQKIYNLFQTLSPSEILRILEQEAEAKSIADAINTYLNRWGFRCSGELMLTSSNYIETPESFIALLIQYEKLPEQDPGKLIHSKYLEARKTKKDFASRILSQNWWFFPKAIWHWFLLNFLIGKASSGISSRERVRLKQAHLYFGFKQTIQKIEHNFINKGIIKAKGDILFLNQIEIAENLDASNMIHETLIDIVESRKKSFNEESKLVYPDDFFTYQGNYAAPENTIQSSNSENKPGTLHGLCACGGSITGTVKVLDSVLQAGKLDKGDILVTRQTDPGWVVVFPLISGLIVERGGMLSHGAIVSREFGIPAIVGVNQATQLLKDGDKIILNADQGEIIICEK